MRFPSKKRGPPVSKLLRLQRRNPSAVARRRLGAFGHSDRRRTRQLGRLLRLAGRSHFSFHASQIRERVSPIHRYRSIHIGRA